MAPLGYPHRRQLSAYTRWRTVRLLIGPAGTGGRPRYLRITENSWTVAGGRRRAATRHRYLAVEAARVHTAEPGAYYRAVRRWAYARVAGAPRSRRDLTELRTFAERHGRRWLRAPARWRMDAPPDGATALPSRVGNRPDHRVARSVAGALRMLVGKSDLPGAAEVPVAGGRAEAPVG
jgi:hypothetical protein